MTEITPEIVRELLDYDPETGALTWREREEKWFKTGRAYSTWNSRYAGKSALSSNSGQGYLRGRILGHFRFAHRVAYAHFHGAWPSQEIDHINQDRSDNRIKNLREVSHSQNMRNQSRRSDNTSGYCGVHRDKKRGGWEARITIKGRYTHLGYFDSKTAAINARKEAELKYGYSDRHGV